MSFLVCFFLLFFINNIDAQNFKKLNYKEIDSLCLVYEAKGDFPKVIELLNLGREKAKKSFGIQDTTYALYTSYAGLFYDRAGQYKIAESLEMEAMIVFEKLLGKTSSKYVDCLNYLGEVYIATGNYDKAEAFLLEAKSLNEKNNQSQRQEYATVLNNLASLYMAIGNFAQAELLHIQVKNIRAKVLGKEHPYYASCLNNLALVYKNTGRYAEAEPLYLESKEIYEKITGKNSHQYAQNISNLALLYYEMEKYDLVEPLLLECKAIYAKTLGKEHPSYASSLNNLAGMYEDMGQYAKSEQLFLEAKDLQEKILGKNHPNYIGVLNNLGVMYADIGKLDLAWYYLNQTLVSVLGFDISININEAWKDTILNANYPSYHHLDKMVRVLRSIYNVLGKDSSSSAKERQIIVTEIVHQLLKKGRDGIVNEQDKLRILSQSYIWMLYSLKVMDLDKQSEKIFEIMELNKAGLLLESTKAEKAYQLGVLPDSLIEEEKILLKKQAKLEAEFLLNRSDQEKEKLLLELNGISHQINVFKKKVEKKYPQYAALKYKQTDISIKDIQQELPESAALIEYVIGDSVVYIFYIDKNKTKVVQQNIAQNELNKRITELKDALSNYALINQKEDKAYRLYVEQAYWFYQNLIAPVLAAKQNINQLIIVSDDALGHLPFETFLMEQAPQTLSNYADLHYLIKDYKISYNYSATLWKTCKEARKRNNNGYLFAMAANYSIQIDSNKKNLRLPTYLRLREHLNPLPAAKKEVEALSKEFSGFFGFDKEASEKIFKEKASDYAVIHLAMHGLLDGNKPILSSLAFTEDGDSVENNFLQAYEISKMELNADLVVLSACETGTGKFEKGNGITSLAQAFAYAGAPAMIVSLWQVSDIATSEIMKKFYHNLADGMQKDEALQQAKIQYMQSAKGIFAHPAFWSPFILMGNTEAVYLKKKGDWIGSVVGGGILLLVGVAIFKLRK